ncbi:MAG: L-histidine N(alpha)-methyltransferase [Gemmatimonadota bacterium]
MTESPEADPSSDSVPGGTESLAGPAGSPDEAAASAEDARERMRSEVLAGLTRPQKEISSKYFYDEVGSRLFEEITRQPEYYPTRVEAALLRRHVPAWVERTGPRAVLELGAGSAAKTRIILDALTASRRGAVYAPVDVSADFLDETAAELRREYPGLDVRPVVADFTRDAAAPSELPRPAWVALLGSTIGNFTHDEARAILAGAAHRMHPEDAFLLGVDLQPGPCKSVARLEHAYNDDAGITAAFNRNVLLVLNRKLGADFDPEAFAHRAFYNEKEGRIEMHLVAPRKLAVRFPEGEEIRFAAGESVRTEISCKYTRPRVERLLVGSGLEVDAWAEDAEGLFALTLLRRVP